MNTPTHRMPRFDREATARDVKLAVEGGVVSNATAIHMMEVADRRHGDLMASVQCHVCGAQLLESLTTGRYEMTHDYAKHHRTPAQGISDAADKVEALRAASLRRAKERDNE